MAQKNQKSKKEIEFNPFRIKRKYNPFKIKTLKRFKIGKISGYLRAVIPNPKDVLGTEKEDGMYYSLNGYKVSPVVYGAERYELGKIYFYEVGANDGSYRKCTTREDAEKRFAQLVEFEKRQMKIQ